MKRSFSIRFLLVCITVAVCYFAIEACYFAIERYNDPAQKYQRTKSEQAMLDLFGDRIHDGSSLQEIHAVLGTKFESVPERYIRTRELAAQRSPADFPAGAEATDNYEWWPCIQSDGRPTKYIFQYRDGKLTNFDAQLPFYRESITALSN